MVSESSLLFQSGLATTVCNLKSDNRDAHSTTVRTEGWTEIWGDTLHVVDDSEECWQLEAAYASRSFENDPAKLVLDHPESDQIPSLTIVQYRPAWLEQLVLRVAGVPHIVQNSSYASNESTGPLPVLRDTQSDLPVLVGRRQPRLRTPQIEISDSTNDKEGGQVSTTTHNGMENDILSYLKTCLKIDLNAPLKENKTLQSQSALFSLLITSKLHYSLMVLRYEDRDAWDQIYRKQCWDCSQNSATSRWDPTSATKRSSRLPSFRGLYQAWSERVLARKLMRTGGRPSLQQAKLEARNAYELLEQQLEERASDAQYLLGTTQPVLVDAILWDHLADALSDMNLVIILADFPLLVQYFQRIHETYFAATTNNSKDVDWKVWNQYQNQINAFQQIPLEAEIKPKEELKRLTHALDLMQTLSVRDHDLVEILKVAKAAREKTSGSTQQQSSSNGKAKPSIPKEEPEKPSLAEAMLRQQERSDQYWVSIMLGTTVLVGLSILGAYEE